MDISTILAQAIESKASDIFIVAGAPLTFKIHGVIQKRGDVILKPHDTRNLIEQIYQYRNVKHDIEAIGEDDFSFSLSNLGRFRVNVYYQRGSLAAVLRVVSFELPNYKELMIPESVMNLSNLTKGLVLVSGSAGAGKSSTLACLIDRINHMRTAHIITIEDPIEYIHRHDLSIVSQREISNDTTSYLNALRAALRQAPNVILVGEMRDLDTIQTVIQAAETGHLVLSTLHTNDAPESINRIINVFPSEQQAQIRVQLSMVLQAIVAQQLLPSKQGKMLPAFEVMLANTAIRTQIRDNKIHQIHNSIINGKQEGMITMDESITMLYQQGLISKETALLYSKDSEFLKRKLV